MDAIGTTILSKDGSEYKTHDSVTTALDYVLWHPQVKTGDFLTVTLANLSEQED